MPLTIPEAQAFVHAHDKVPLTDTEQEILREFEAKIDQAISGEFSGEAFVKLSTRSPKDSQLLYQKGVTIFEEELKTYSERDGNILLIKYCEAVIKAMKVISGKETIELLCDSNRIWEDLTYALQDPNTFSVSVLIREWSFAPIAGEWRGFVWDGTLNAVGQYYFFSYFEELQGKEKEIGEKFVAFFDEIKGSIHHTHYILDLCVRPDGKILLVEVNPFDGIIGTIRASTGLFNWDVDQAIMQNGPLEIRVNKTKFSWSQLKFKIDKDYANVVQPHVVES
eukprot:TRINITY_DN6819_c0_g2_i1.p1 TRINITY_DN6819_c0_g2~~TRINITY_DN6819_c0_g2_i1.p1  ORF type:complete len:280 (+),score=79.91 TRINITY_DN6819_c0_g2_i1:113-952(+)